MRSMMLGAAILATACVSDASAQSRCRVLDPTGTPLNVRAAPNGAIIGTLTNGMLVSVLDRSVDASGRPWVYVASRDSGAPLGWVFREFIACF
ncbi:MAG: SH3 domain-containing protein [Hyphomicrobiales bacterium]